MRRSTFCSALVALIAARTLGKLRKIMADQSADCGKRDGLREGAAWIQSIEVVAGKK